jgi:L-fuculose-phosphate aldolase
MKAIASGPPKATSTTNGGGEFETAMRHELVLIARLLFERGLMVGIDGNLSVRVGEDRLLCTPGGAIKGLLRPEELVAVDLEGRPLGPGRPSSELALHLAAYRLRPEVGAVIHAHPPTVIALSIAGLDFLPEALPEALLICGLPAVVPYAPPSSPEGARAAEPAISQADTLILSRHGSLALAVDLRQAFARTESLEQLAAVAARLHAWLGPPALECGVDWAAARKLLGVRRALGMAAAGDEARWEAYWAGLAASGRPGRGRP